MVALQKAKTQIMVLELEKKNLQSMVTSLRDDKDYLKDQLRDGNSVHEYSLGF